jgi:LPPG:FO 2-phospho-L-lactate transferase
MRVVALAGGVGAGKFLRGLVRAVPAGDITVVVNTGDDIRLHGLWISPDVDSVIYWLAGLADRERGWGREGESFRATTELGRLGASGSWFSLGDLDLATHLLRAGLLEAGQSLSQATSMLALRNGLTARILPMTDQAVTTRVEVADGSGRALDLHFQQYWVERGARDEVKAIRFEGIERARPAPGVLQAISDSEAVLLCPSNPIVSIDPILAVPGIEDALRSRRDRVAGISPIVGGAPLRGMADRLLAAAGVEVSAAGVAGHYAARRILGGWVMDDLDRDLVPRAEALDVRVSVTDTIMVDDAAAERLARVALATALGDGGR